MIVELAELCGRERDVARIGRSISAGDLAVGAGVLQRLLEIQRLQIARDIAGRVGIGDVLRQHVLALIEPGHALAQHRQAAVCRAGSSPVTVLLALKTPPCCARHA